MLQDVNWDEFQDSDTDTFYQHFVGILGKVIEACVPVQRKSKKNNIYMTKEAMHLKKQKQDLWRRYIRNPSLINHIKFKQTRNVLRRQTRELRRSFEKQLASNIKETPKAFWHYVNSRTKTKSRVANLKASDEMDAEAITDSEKAIELSKFFSSVYTVENTSEIPCLPERFSLG